ncbi:MAG: bifunctional DNA-formamidopyrimidine glycosylase/DNA-(apurinic or apyrimidinic site) lyase [Candidatus Moranbacteria bacterium]|nr:bifunctional DNA-formamidopyrimidine glycosylase/DNA-(apurinic or apyrimidinic site) lyase [Candidatus Moranbacteria bacterium]
MPELPEVKTIAGDLNRKVKGDTIVDFWTDWKKSVKPLTKNGARAGMPLEKFIHDIKGRKILNAYQIGKNLMIDLSGGKTLYIHLKMTGHLLVKSSKLKVKSGGKDYFSEKVNQYIHHIFYLKSGRTMEFSDLRKFGKIILDDKEKIYKLNEIKSLGADVASSEFTFEKFDKILDKKTTKIKLLLMDQTKLAGIGNIYASEILYEAGVLPDRPAGNIKPGERKKIFAAIQKIIQKAIKLRGTSDSDFRDTDGAPGHFQEVLQVYRRTGKKCPRCGTMVERIKMGQRGTFYCPVCQR